jgi:prefoldin subunit 5
MPKRIISPAIGTVIGTAVVVALVIGPAQSGWTSMTLTSYLEFLSKAAGVAILFAGAGGVTYGYFRSSRDKTLAEQIKAAHDALELANDATSTYKARVDQLKTLLSELEEKLKKSESEREAYKALTDAEMARRQAAFDDECARKEDEISKAARITLGLQGDLDSLRRFVLHLLAVLVEHIDGVAFDELVREAEKLGVKSDATAVKN